MDNKTFFHSFDKIETKADVLKYALEFTQDNGKPNYDNVPEAKQNYMDAMLNVLDKMNTKPKE